MQRGDYMMQEVPAYRDYPSANASTPDMQSYYDDTVSLFLF